MRKVYGHAPDPEPNEVSAAYRVIIADDHPAIVEAVARFLDGEDEVELVGRARDGDQALLLVAQHAPDVAILDIRMPGTDGIEVARRLHAEGAATAIILYTANAERAVLLEALDAGAHGFLLKEAPLDDLMRAVRMVANGGTYVDAALAGVLAGPQAADRLPKLTKREREVLRLLADGMRNEQVSVELSISPLTVRSHVKNAMARLEADTRTQAVARALRDSLIT
ncbi:MAG: hypothetical protein QOJ43_1629 [Gaiellaceae bacterium]|nr:hypothetical protein [Gaiellaceae bacterium]